MRPSDMPGFAKVLATAMDFYRREVTPQVIDLWYRALAGFELEDISAGFTAHLCDPERGEFPPVPATIIKHLARITGAARFARLSANEAWARCLPAADERNTVVWTAEMAAAWFAAWPVMQAGDEVGARMAFIAAYEREVMAAGDAPPKWSVCAGHDPELRALAVQQAVQQQLLTLSPEQAAAYLPAPGPAAFNPAALLTGSGEVFTPHQTSHGPALLEGPESAPMTAEQVENTRKHLAEIRAQIEGGESWEERRMRIAREKREQDEARKAEAIRQAEEHMKNRAPENHQ